jgi:threonine/homoserine/homoserine lactone efflux protein
MPVPLDQLLLFLPGSILITVLPGADMALVMRQVFIGGTRLAQRTIFGNLSGLAVHALALAAGLSALLAASAEAYTVVKLAGAAYLVYLGVQTLLASRRRDAEAAEAAASGGVVAARGVPSMRTAYLQGLVSTVLNPKPALLFLTYLPQFIDQSHPVLPQIAFLAGVHILVGLIWMTLYAHLVARAHRTLTRSDVRRWLERVTGVVLIAFGLRVAIEQR